MKVLLKLDGRTASGGSSLIMHNARLLDPLDEFTRAVAAISGKRKKTDADHLEISRLEFFGGLYSDPVIASPSAVDGQQPALMGFNIFRCLQDGGKRHKRGQDVLRGVYPLAEYVPLAYEGPQKASALWRSPEFVLRKDVGISGRRVMRTRPIFANWQAELPVEIDPKVFDLDTVRTIWADAGIYAGLGEMRPIYGRFNGTVEEAA